VRQRRCPTVTSAERNHPGEAGVVKGEPRSLVKMKGDASRWSRRKARRIG
jgi:hypothetical protein